MRRGSMLNGITILPPTESSQLTNEPIPTNLPEIAITEPISPQIDNTIPDTKKSITKTVLDNSHILKMNNNTQTPSPIPNIKYETNKLNDNTLAPKECAKFSITTDLIDPIIHATFEILTDAGIIHDAHIESILENTFTVIINNLTDTVMNFGIQYLTLHKL